MQTLKFTMECLRIKSKTDIILRAMFFSALFLCIISFSHEHLLFLHNDMSFHYLFRRLRVISAILFVIKLVFDLFAKRIKISELVPFILLIPAIIYYISYFYDFDIDKMRFLNISLMFILAVSGSDIDYHEIIKTVLFFMFVSYISIGVLNLLGNLEFWHTLSADGRYRNFVGFSWTDISYRFLNFLMIYGWVAFVVLLLVLFYFSLLIRKKKDIYMMVVFIMLLLFSITDLGITELISNYFFFILSYKNTSIITT